MEPYWQQDGCTIHHEDCREVMEQMPPNSVDTIITDPPYGLAFMGQDWDHGVPGEPFWEAALDVAKPGAILLAFGGTRTWHRLACVIEDAGWEIRDTLMWLYGQGFPKPYSFADEAGEEWQGWNVALKPAWEPLIMAQAPLDGTYAENAQKHGVAGLNIDGCRIACEERKKIQECGKDGVQHNTYGKRKAGSQCVGVTNKGRWPANVLLDPASAELLDEQSGESVSSGGDGSGFSTSQFGLKGDDCVTPGGKGYGDTGGASRFFYTAKASRAEREAGLFEMPKRRGSGPLNLRSDAHSQRNDMDTVKRNSHPTVKPLDLLRWLVRLTKTPTGGTVLDPFMGSGTTGMACVLEDRDFVGIEQHDTEDKPYCTVAKKRIQWVQRCGEDFVEADKQERKKQKTDQSHLF